MQKFTKFILAISIQIIIILGLLLFKLTVLTAGTEVLLKIEPVDPTDPFRGDYITFSYDISEIPYYHFYDEERTPKVGDTVYVLLARYGSKYWEIKDAMMNQPLGGDIFLKAKVTSIPDTQNIDKTENVISGEPLPKTDFRSNFGVSDQPVEVIYGLEEYFIPEGVGRHMSFFEKEMAAKVIVDDNGNGVLKQIYLDDQPWP